LGFDNYTGLVGGLAPPDIAKEDFSMKIGVRLHSFADPEWRTALSYAEIREMAQAAEAGGLDSVWLSDHLIYRFDPQVTSGPWECWTVLSALAEATSRVELGTIVLCNPFRNPALLAKMAHTLDEISRGRVILGVGAGWHEPEFDAFGYAFDHRVDRMEEALQILRPLLKGEGVDFAGKHYQVKDCVITPLGPRPEGIPLLVGAFGPRMLRLAAHYADQWNTAWLGDPLELAEPSRRLRDACVQVGRDPATIDVTAGVSISFPDLGETRSFAKKPLAGTAASLVQAFRGYADAGAAHLIIQPTPAGLPALERVMQAVRLYRNES
jgi:probable F420-dependent oxidoreductase